MSLYFSDEHVWIRTEDDIATIGISPHAQETLGDIVFVDLPEVGKTIEAKSIAGVVESVKAASDVFMPASGTVLEVNEALRADPALANTDPLGAGWFFKARLSQPAELDALMQEGAYTAFAASA